MATSLSPDLRWSIDVYNHDRFSPSYTLVGRFDEPARYVGDGLNVTPQRLPGGTTWIKVPITHSDLSEIAEANRLDDLDLLDETFHVIAEAYLANG